MKPAISSKLLCEWDAAAQRVLAARFADMELVGDVADLEELPTVDLVTAGFPCQDLSQAGRTVGITGLTLRSRGPRLPTAG